MAIREKWRYCFRCATGDHSQHLPTMCSEDISSGGVCACNVTSVDVIDESMICDMCGDHRENHRAHSLECVVGKTTTTNLPIFGTSTFVARRKLPTL
jgi:hypothetical protein